MAAARRRLRALAGQLNPSRGPSPPAAGATGGTEHEPLIGEAERSHLEEEGWLHVPALLAPELIEAMQREIWTLLEATPDDRASWYNRPADSFNPSRDQPGCHLLLFATQAQYDIMTHPRTYQLFRELWGVDELWCGAAGGGVLMKPPADPTVPLPDGEEGSDGNGDEAHWGAPHRLHWDINPHEVAQGGRLRPDGGRGRWQASLALMDAGADAGGTYAPAASTPPAPTPTRAGVLRVARGAQLVRAAVPPPVRPRGLPAAQRSGAARTLRRQPADSGRDTRAARRGDAVGAPARRAGRRPHCLEQPAASRLRAQHLGRAAHREQHRADAAHGPREPLPHAGKRHHLGHSMAV